jgi:hypothetical protein
VVDVEEMLAQTREVEMRHRQVVRMICGTVTLIVMLAAALVDPQHAAGAAPTDVTGPVSSADSVPDGRYRIRAEVSGPGRALDVTDCQNLDGADVRIWDWISSSPCQRWRVTRDGDTYFIIDGNSGRALNQQRCTGGNHEIIDLHHLNGSTCQRWRIEPTGDGAYRVLAVNGGRSLDVAGCSSASGANVILWDYHGGACQRWYFESADGDLKLRRKGVVPPGGITSSKTGGNTIDAELREAQPRADGYRHYDSVKLVERLKAMNANTYLFGIWESPTDWDDLRNEFAPLARAAGIDIWVDLVPPSECQADRPEGPYLEGYCSRPYKLDFIAWARAIADLSLQYPNVKAWQIDDFLVGENSRLFTTQYLGAMKAAQDQINPNLGFLTTMYLHDYTDANLVKLAPYIDGVLYPYLGAVSQTTDPRFVEQHLNQLLAKLNPRGLDLIPLFYTDRFLDAPLPPSPEYVDEVLRRAAPYAADGRIGGVVAYGAPVHYDRRPTISSNNLARTGIGRLSFAQGNGAHATAGAFAAAHQQVTVDPGAASYRLDFATYDQDMRTPAKVGQLFKEVLVDDRVAWRSDVTDPHGFTWVPATVDLTAALRGKTTAKLSLRLYVQNNTEHFPVDVGFDSLVPTGFTIANADFEDASPATRAWRLAQQSTTIYASFEKWTGHQAKDVYDAIAAAFAGAPAPAMPSTPHQPTPVVSTPAAPYRPGAINTVRNGAMYGRGRLSLFVPEATSTSTNACTWAEQTVAVDPAAPRYELSWWWYDQYAGGLPGYHLKQFTLVTSKGKKLISNMDVVYDPGNQWMNNQGLWGLVDLTQFVRGETRVTLQFALCEQNGVGDYMADVGVDEIEATGMTIVNGGFEQGSTGWTLVNAHSFMKAQVITAP